MVEIDPGIHEANRDARARHRAGACGEFDVGERPVGVDRIQPPLVLERRLLCVGGGKLRLQPPVLRFLRAAEIGRLKARGRRRWRAKGCRLGRRGATAAAAAASRGDERKDGQQPEQRRSLSPGSHLQSIQLTEAMSRPGAATKPRGQCSCARPALPKASPAKEARGGTVGRDDERTTDGRTSDALTGDCRRSPGTVPGPDARA